MRFDGIFNNKLYTVIVNTAHEMTSQDKCFEILLKFSFLCV